MCGEYFRIRCRQACNMLTVEQSFLSKINEILRNIPLAFIKAPLSTPVTFTFSHIPMEFPINSYFISNPILPRCISLLCLFEKFHLTPTTKWTVPLVSYVLYNHIFRKSQIIYGYVDMLRLKYYKFKNCFRNIFHLVSSIAKH